MSQPGVSYKRVVEAIEQVAESGQRVTSARVREVLGGGNPQAISKFVKLWQEQKIAEIQNEHSGSPKQQPLDLEEPNPSDDEKPSPQKETTPVAKSKSSDNNKPTSQKKTTPVAESKPKDASMNKRASTSVDSPQNKPSSSVESAPRADKRHVSFKEEEQFITKPLESMTNDELTITIRRLQSALAKEEIRRETALKMASEAKEYAAAIKDQVAQRINELKQTMEESINQLKAEAKSIKQQSDEDLRFYREQLEKANNKIISMVESSDN